MKQAQREVTEAGSRVQINILDFKYNCMYNFNMEANMHVCACLLWITTVKQQHKITNKKSLFFAIDGKMPHNPYNLK